MQNKNGLKNKNELRKKLRVILIENCINAKVLTQVKSDLLEVGILGGTVQDMFTQRITTEQLSDEVLYYLSDSLSKALDLETIKPERYFMDEEIEEIKRLNTTKLSGEDTLPFKFYNVMKVDYDMFVTFISAKELADLYNKGRIRYRMETQRNATIIKRKGTLIQTPTINNRSIEEIKEQLLKGQFITNFITLNTIEDDTLEYDEKTGELKVNTILDILDGFHRSMGILRAVAESDGEINYTTGVVITNFDIDKAQRYIVQEDKKNKMSKRFIKYLNKDSKANIVVRKINEDSYSDLNGKIVTDKKFIRYGNALTLTDVMQQGIDSYFKFKTMSDINKLADYLIEGFNHIIGLYPEQFIDEVKKHKETSVIAHEHMFVGYLYILSELRGKNDWKNKLEKILSQINFDKDNPIWEEIGLFKPELTARTIKELEDYLKNFF